MKKLEIKQIRSAIDRHFKQKQTIRALGIRKLNQTVIHNDTPQIRGMISKVSHLVEVRELDDEPGLGETSPEISGEDQTTEEEAVAEEAGEKDQAQEEQTEEEQTEEPAEETEQKVREENETS